MKIYMPEDVKFIIDIFNKNNYEAYIVGGCVRDSILKRKPQDWDICTNCNPEETMEIFKDYNVKTIPTGIEHGTITIVKNSKHYEVTTYRIEEEYRDHRRPSGVSFTNDLKKDLSRRDFTINAMAYDDNDGIIDPFNGLEDLENNIIRTVGIPQERFKEDALRILRGIRFSGQLDFNIEKNTKEAMLIKGSLLEKISKERIRDEINKMLLSHRPSISFNTLKELDLFDYTIPELKATIDFEQKNPHHDKDVYSHIMLTLDNTERDLPLRLAALLHDIGKPKCFTIGEDGIGHFYRHHMIGMDMSEEILKRLKYDNKTIKTVKVLIKEHMFKQDKLSDRAIKRFINRIGGENLERFFKLQTADIKASKPPYDFDNINYIKEKCKEILNRKEPLNVKELNINGYDLMEIGIKQGKEIGDILNYLLEKVLDNSDLNNKKDLMELAKEKAGGQ